MKKGSFKIIGVTISISFVMVIAILLFMKAIGILFNTWFVNNAQMIAILSGIVIFIGIITGSIAIGNLLARGKGFI